jgi:imidazoleglycerol-phosphate dehydratase/histidinol-phosphatase
VKKALFIDRDGTIITEPDDEQVDSLDKLSFLPGVIPALHRIAAELDYELVMATNQDGLGTASFPEDTFWPAHSLMLSVLESAGVRFADVLIDRSFPEDNAPTRKPGTAMFTRYTGGDYDLGASFVIGDRDTDVELARNLGAGAIRISNEPDPRADLSTSDWNAVYRFLRGLPRSAVAQRETRETNITVRLNLDGGGESRVETGLSFLDHMLDQVARHSGCDLDIRAVGDLEVDEHHTVEDTAIVLGQALKKALGNKYGIGRFGFAAPMDDAQARVALDLSGRAYLAWNAEFRREYVGDVPTELFPHFFRSFCESASCTLHVDVSGENEHHKIESVFKAFARCLGQAAARSGSGLPTTKGEL